MTFFRRVARHTSATPCGAGPHTRHLAPLVLLVAGAAVILAVVLALPAAGQTQPPNRYYLPLITNRYVPPEQRLCRLGIGASQDLDKFPVHDLRAGWYVDWGAAAYPRRPGGMEYMPTIRLRQTGRDSYAVVSPPAPALTATVQAQPGATWLIGNEPDRRQYQDDLQPQVYARAYHDLYYQIKRLAPDAQVVAGNIVQPTPLRLQYLDLVLSNYRQIYGENMPVDGWAIHTYALQEKSCSVYPEDCWGAEIPPGITAGQGALYTIQDSANPDIMKQLVTGFRQWMADRGYRDRPLFVPEWGVLMWPVYIDAARVNAYMDATATWLAGARDANTGYPADDNRLVQRAAWYSLTDTTFNGWLYESTQVGGTTVVRRTIFGDNFVKNSALIPPSVNLKAVALSVQVADDQTVTLTATVANNGNIDSSYFVVRFYDGPPGAGGKVIGEARRGVLPGCATPLASFSVLWSGAAAGSHTVYAVVNPDDSLVETTKSDNQISATVSLSALRGHLPALLTMGGPR